MREQWTTGTLSDFADANPREPPLAPDAPFVPMEAIEPGTRWTVATKLRENRGGARFRGGDVLFARITPCLENGKVAQWPFHGDRAGGSTEFIVLRARPALDPSFLYYWATSSRVRDAATALMVGSTGRQRLAPGDLAAIPVTMPPIDEQRRIADLLTAIGQAEGASRLLEVEAQRLLRALLHTAIGDEDWDARTLGQVADIRSGITKGRKAKGALVPRPYLRAANVQDGRLDLDDVQTIDVTEEEARRYLLRSGDLLLVEGSGSRARLGTGWVWEGQVEGCLHQNHVFRARPDTDVVLPAFLAYWVTSSYARGYFAGCTKTTSGLATINKSQVMALPIYVAPLGEQRALVARLDAVREARDGASEQARALGECRRAILSELLSGEHAIPVSYDRFLAEAPSALQPELMRA